MAAEYPYDGEVSGHIDWAHATARGVLLELGNRSGIGDELDAIDLGIRKELVESIAAIIRAGEARRKSQN